MAELEDKKKKKEEEINFYVGKFKTDIFFFKTEPLLYSPQV